MSEPEFRWEFVVNFSGFGRTKEEAWDQVMEGVVQDGVSCGLWVEARTDKEAGRMRRKGESHVVRCEPSLDAVPDGAMLVWED